MARIVRGHSRSRDGIAVMELSRWERDHYGCIVTFSDGRSRWFPGLDCLAEACEYADAHGLRIGCISKPTTIYRDLQGTRAQEPSPEGEMERGGKRSKRKVGGVVYFPEVRMLGKLGRADLLETDPVDREGERRRGRGSRVRGGEAEAETGQ